MAEADLPNPGYAAACCLQVIERRLVQAIVAEGSPLAGKGPYVHSLTLSF